MDDDGLNLGLDHRDLLYSMCKLKGAGGNYYYYSYYSYSSCVQTLNNSISDYII